MRLRHPVFPCEPQKRDDALSRLLHCEFETSISQPSLKPVPSPALPCLCSVSFPHLFRTCPNGTCCGGCHMTPRAHRIAHRSLMVANRGFPCAQSQSRECGSCACVGYRLKSLQGARRPPTHVSATRPQVTSVLDILTYLRYSST